MPGHERDPRRQVIYNRYPVYFATSIPIAWRATEFFNQIELDDVAGEGEANAESDIDLLVTAVCGPGLNCKLPKRKRPKGENGSKKIHLCRHCMISNKTLQEKRCLLDPVTYELLQRAR